MIKNTEGGLLDYKKNAFTFSSTCDSTGWNQIQESPCLHCQSAWRRSRRAIERRQREQNQYFYRSSSLGLVRVDVTWSPFLSLSLSAVHPIGPVNSIGSNLNYQQKPAHILYQLCHAWPSGSVQHSITAGLVADCSSYEIHRAQQLEDEESFFVLREGGWFVH